MTPASIAYGRRTPAQHARALTLVEILAVLVILALVAGTLAAGFGGLFGQSKRELAKTGISIVEQKLQAYRLVHDGYPGTELGVAALTDGQAVPDDAYYLKPDQTLDPWGRPFEVIVPGPDGHPFEIVSYGSDGAPGGSGEAQDLSSLSLRENGP